MNEKSLKSSANLPPTGLLDVRSVAELLNCSTRHVYRMADARKLPQPVRLGVLVRWPKAKIESWIDDGCPSFE